MPTTKFADLPVAPAGTAWDKGEANQNVQKWAGGDDLDMAKYSKAFFWVAENPPEKIGDCKLPFADVIDGKLTAIPKGIGGCVGAFNGAHGNKVDIPDADDAGVKAHISKYYKKMGQASPFADEKTSPRFDEDGFSREAVRSAVPEMRTLVVPLRDLEWRTSGSGDGSRIIQGYAAVCNQRTTLYDGVYYRWTEALAPGAFNRVLAANPQVSFDIGHDLNTVMADTHATDAIGKLELRADDNGLHMYARLDPTDFHVGVITPKMARGIMNQGSFMFNVAPAGVRTVQNYDDTGKLTEDDTIIDISELRDVCVCAQGAYPTTSLALRANLRMGAHVFSREVSAPDAGAPLAVASQTNGTPLAVGRDLAALRAKARVAAHTFQTKE